MLGIGLYLRLVLSGAILNAFKWLTQCFFAYIPIARSEKLPPIKDPLLTVSATELARKIREKRLTSERVVQCYIQRIRDANPTINAIVQHRFNEALDEAKAIDEFIKTRKYNVQALEKRKPLLGVPFTVKESCSLEGMETTFGSLLASHVVSKHDGEVVLRMKDAGAIPLLISNTPEFCASWETNNLVTGRTNNPYDTTRTCGGSSGGEGALIASAASIMGVGSDVGGSIRVPCMYNGIYGHKPSRGIVPNAYHVPPTTNPIVKKLLCIGPMCRYAEDLTLMMKVMARDEENHLGLDEQISMKNVQVFYVDNNSHWFYQIPVQDSIRRAIRRAAEFLEIQCKAKVNRYKFPELSNAMIAVIPGLITAASEEERLKNPDILTGFQAIFELLKSLVGRSKYSFQMVFFYLLVHFYHLIFKGTIKDCKIYSEKLRRQVLSKLGTNGVILYPIFPLPAPKHYEFCTRVHSLMYTQVFNVLGMPCTAVPMGFDDDGMPIGIQVIAAPYQDKLCLAVARHLTTISGWVPPS